MKILTATKNTHAPSALAAANESRTATVTVADNTGNTLALRVHVMVHRATV